MLRESINKQPITTQLSVNKRQSEYTYYKVPPIRWQGQILTLVQIYCRGKINCCGQGEVLSPLVSLLFSLLRASSLRKPLAPRYWFLCTTCKIEFNFSDVIICLWVLNVILKDCLHAIIITFVHPFQGYTMKQEYCKQGQTKKEERKVGYDHLAHNNVISTFAYEYEL